MRLLDLFCGTKSVSNVFKTAGYDVVNLDYDKQFDATHVEDILTWDYTKYPSGYFDVIWASPDCTTWSIATGGKYRLKTDIWGLPNEHLDKTVGANNMILRVIEILKYFKPKTWFIENPRGLLQHFPPLKTFVEEQNACKTLVYYANYNNWGFPKPTHIWSNLVLWENETMPEMPESSYTIHTKKNGELKKYYNAFKFGKTRERSKIPPNLIDRLRRLANPDRHEGITG